MSREGGGETKDNETRAKAKALILVRGSMEARFLLRSLKKARIKSKPERNAEVCTGEQT